MTRVDRSEVFTLNDAKRVRTAVVDIVDEVRELWPGFTPATACVFQHFAVYEVNVGELPRSYIAILLNRASGDVAGARWCTTIRVSPVRGMDVERLVGLIATVVHEVELDAVGL